MIRILLCLCMDNYAFRLNWELINLVQYHVWILVISSAVCKLTTVLLYAHVSDMFAKE
jgi:hypothetical protein